MNEVNRMNKSIRLSSKQASLLDYCRMSEAGELGHMDKRGYYAETGQYKPWSMSTIESLQCRGLLLVEDYHPVYFCKLTDAAYAALGIERPDEAKVLAEQQARQDEAEAKMPHLIVAEQYGVADRYWNGQAFTTYREQACRFANRWLAEGAMKELAAQRGLNNLKVQP